MVRLQQHHQNLPFGRKHQTQRRHDTFEPKFLATMPSIEAIEALSANPNPISLHGHVCLRCQNNQHNIIPLIALLSTVTSSFYLARADPSNVDCASLVLRIVLACRS